MIKVLVPSMPPIDSAIPYYRMAEEARWFSNWGPCVKRLEERLENKFGCHVVTCSSCTTGLEMLYTLVLLSGFRSIELPALTFPATWLAANRSGLHIIPADVDVGTWNHPSVALFGVPSYSRVVDAAASFGEQTMPEKGSMTAVISMHCTKTLGVGEGGFILTRDIGEAEELRSMSNFGIDPKSKMSIGHGTNAKMSEIHAAFGLAALDRWDETRARFLQLHDWYDELLPSCVQRQKRPRGVYPILSVYTRRPAAEVVKAMADRGIETRRWYTPLLTEHPLFQKMGSREYRRAHPARIPVSQDLAAHLIGLPYHLQLTRQDVEFICEQLEQVVNEQCPSLS